MNSDRLGNIEHSDTDDWRDDTEADALIAAIHEGETVHDAIRALQVENDSLRQQLRGAVEALEAFALDKWGTTNPILVPDDERELQQAYYRAHSGGQSQ